MKNLDPHSIPLQSINLIEASAGTGKSWTVTLLYLRLILEKMLTVDQILVVTFTDAATKELRDDIRNRLIEALAAFESENYEKNDEYQQLIINSQDKEAAIRCLNRAKLSLDEASIFTIHSFCQRALTENAFEAGLPFESELMDDDRELMQNLTDDFWRRNFYNAPPALLFKLQQKSITPDSLLNDVLVAVGKPYLELRGPDIEKISADKWHELEILFKNAMSHWKQSREEIVALLNDPALEKGYKKLFINARDESILLLDGYARFSKLPSKIDTKKTSWLGTKPKVNKGYELGDHPFFSLWQEFIETWDKLSVEADHFINQIRIQLLKHLQEELPKEKLRRGVLSFDDLLLQLQHALRTNAELSLSIRKKYKAALIDEFQDTDPIQYEIFNTIFSDEQNSLNHAVFLVGDPKQAIYSFRGGDIYTYLKAKANTLEDNQYTLKTNWRSHPQLISAFNTLYLSSKNPFQDEGINYIKVQAGSIVTDALKTFDKRSPLRFWQVELADEAKSAPKIREEIANAVAGDIATLLNDPDSKIGDKRISGGDIAILIRSHTHGDLIKQALSARGIPSVQSSKESIFQTHEAVEIHRLLTAIAEPQREDNVRRALVTELMGYQAKELLNFEEDSKAWEDKLLAMQQWHYQWQKKGFLPMMRDLMQAEKMHQHLLSFDDGERRLTNVLHLAELIHHQSKKQSFSIEELLRWLQQQRENPSSKEVELRLESDEKLVKIVTIHKSKGLEYPIVYCPFVGIGSKATPHSIFVFHDNEKPCLEIGSINASEHKRLKAEEESAEDTRLLYVALTRAKYQCTVVCMPEAIKGTPDRTALGWLLSDGKTIKENKEAFYLAYNERLQSLAADDSIELSKLPEFLPELSYQPEHIEQELTAKEFSAVIKQQAQMTSFSGLTAGVHAEAPDYDADSTPIVALPDSDEIFPKGATAGTALHEIYENLDFKLAITDQRQIILDTLNKWSFDSKYEKPAQDLIENSLEAELFSGFSLKDLSKDKRLDEMEFYLPLNRLKIDDLKQILFKYLPKDWQVVRNAVNTLYFEQVEGYLKGFIDLIFEYEGKYYLADYKSNSLNDYEQDSLLATMADSHYYLQALIYSVALHRYLQKRIPDYSWDTHFGGTYYLFIRGMSADVLSTENKKTFKNGRGGIFFYKPSIELIEAMDNLFVESLI